MASAAPARDYITFNGLPTLERKARLAGAWGAGVMVWRSIRTCREITPFEPCAALLYEGHADAREGSQVESVTSSQRLVSPDLLRGLTVIGMILVNAMAGMEGKGPVYPTLLHERWDGLHLADVVFPAFLLMVGISIPLSMRGRVGNPRDEYARFFRRECFA